MYIFVNIHISVYKIVFRGIFIGNMTVKNNIAYIAYIAYVKYMTIKEDLELKKPYWHNNWHKIILVNPEPLQKKAPPDSGVLREI